MRSSQVFRIAFKNQTALLGGELAPGNVCRNCADAGPFFQVLKEGAEARLGPGLDGAVVQGFAGIGHDEIEIEIDGVAKALAARAGAERIVKGEEARLRFLIESAVVLAFEAFVEIEALGGIAGGIGDEFEDGFAGALAIADLDGIDEAGAGFGIDGEAIDEDVDGLHEIHVQQRFGRREFVDAAILIKTVEATFLEFAKSETK